MLPACLTLWQRGSPSESSVLGNRNTHYDLTFHAVDLAHLRDELVPWILGHREAFPRLKDCARRLHTRYLASQFGLDLLGRCPSRPRQEAGAIAHRFGRLLGRKEASSDPAAVSVPSTLGNFHPELHVFGRPYLIGASTSEAVAAQVDRFREATEDPHVLELIAQQFGMIAPGAQAPVLESVPFDAGYAEESIMAMLRTMRVVLSRREAYAEEPPPHDARLDDILLRLVEVAGIWGGTWMARGPGPSTLLERVGVQLIDLEDAFSFAIPLFSVMPRLKWSIEQTIDHPSDVGCLAEPQQVPALRSAILRNRHALQQLVDDLYLQKLDECLAFAEARNLAFVECAGVMRRRDLAVP